MATASTKPRCVSCGKEKAVMKCGGCSQDFCFNHMTNHRQVLSKQLDEVEVTRDLFQQALTEQSSKPEKHALMQQIDQWERDSMAIIRKTAEKAREQLLKHTTEYFKAMEIKLKKLTDQLRESRQENDFFEADLQQWKQELDWLKNELDKPSNLGVIDDKTPLVNKIRVSASASSYIQNISANAKWIQNGIIVAGNNGAGNGVNQLMWPCGVYVDDDETVYVAEHGNHRIMEWKNGATSGRVLAGNNGPGNRTDQLNGPTDVILDRKSDSLIICDYNNERVVRWPRQGSTTGETIKSNIGCWGLVMDNDGYLYISDYKKHEVRRWKVGETNETVVAGGNGQGHRLDQLYGPSYVFLDQNHAVYVSDTGNHRVMKWGKDAKEGTVVAGGQGSGNGLNLLSGPFGVFVDQLGTTYVTDHNNHRVMRWTEGATEGSVVVDGNGQGAQSNQLNYPLDLSFDIHNNLYVVNYYNHRVQKFNIDPNSNV